MSVRVMAMVWECDALKDKSELLVMLALADWSDDKGRCFPGMKAIAEKARMSRRNVQYVLQRLRDERGLISWEENRGRNATNAYQINLEALHLGAPVKGAKAAHLDGDKTRNGCRGATVAGVQNETVKCAKALHPNHQEPSVERETPRAREREAMTHDLFDAFWETYPRKVKKKTARQRWRSKKLHEKPDLAREIIADVERRSADDEQWQDARYIPHPSTYLNQERWHDEILPEVGPRGVSRPRGKAGLDAQARHHQAPRKRDGELSPAEYLERAGYSRAEAERLLGLPVGDDRDDQPRLPPAPSGDGR